MRSCAEDHDSLESSPWTRLEALRRLSSTEPGPWHIGCLVALSGEDPGLVNVSARWLVKIPKASIGLPMH